MWKISKVRGPWETEAAVRWGRGERVVVIEIEPRCLVLRPKGTRQRFRLPFERALQLAVTAHVEAQREAGRKGKTRRTVRRGVMALK